MISLLPHAYKIYTTILLKKLQNCCDSMIFDSQNGFRSKRGTRDNLFLLRAMTNHVVSKNESAAAIFVDFRSAFDSEGHLFLEYSLIDHNVPPQLLQAILSIYSNAKARVKSSDGSRSDYFKIERGVLQGDGLSTCLFTIAVNSIWRLAMSQGPWQGYQVTPDWIVYHLDFADDVLLFARTIAQATEVLRRLAEAAGEASISINADKCIAMILQKKLRTGKTTENDVDTITNTVKCPRCERPFANKHGLAIHVSRWCTGRRDDRSRSGQLLDKVVKQQKRGATAAAIPPIYVGNDQVRFAASTVYLGSCHFSHGGSDEEVSRRISLAKGAFASIWRIWSCQSISTKHKLAIYECYVVSILLYGCESWLVNNNSRSKLRGFNARCCAAIAGCRLRDDHSRTAEFDIEAKLLKLRWCWLGHVLRTDPSRLIHKPLSLPPTSGSVISLLPWPLTVAIRYAQDRSLWKSLIPTTL
jgi:hypothetical protein